MADILALILVALAIADPCVKVDMRELQYINILDIILFLCRRSGWEDFNGQQCICDYVPRHTHDRCPWINCFTLKFDQGELINGDVSIDLAILENAILIDILYSLMKGTKLDRIYLNHILIQHNANKLCIVWKWEQSRKWKCNSWWAAGACGGSEVGPKVWWRWQLAARAIAIFLNFQLDF